MPACFSLCHKKLEGGREGGQRQGETASTALPVPPRGRPENVRGPLRTNTTAPPAPTAQEDGLPAPPSPKSQPGMWFTGLVPGKTHTRRRQAGRRGQQAAILGKGAGRHLQMGGRRAGGALHREQSWTRSYLPALAKKEMRAAVAGGAPRRCNLVRDVFWGDSRGRNRTRVFFKTFIQTLAPLYTHVI